MAFPNQENISIKRLFMKKVKIKRREASAKRTF